jgi:hypothetical protein
MGSEETGSRDYSGYPVTTTSVTATIGRPPRKLYFMLQVVAFALTLAVAFLAERYERDFAEMEMTMPWVSTILVALGKFLRQPLGLSCVAALILGLGLLAFKGAMDGILKAMIWLNVLWIVGVAGIYFLGGVLPIQQFRERLGN